MDTLRKFTTGMLNSDEIKQAAQRGLLLEFGDKEAGEQVAKSLKGGMFGAKPREQRQAAETLMLAGDERGYEWATEALKAKRKGGRFSLSKGEYDPFGDALRFMMLHPGERSTQVLRDALAKTKGGDEREALLAIAMANAGDASELARVRDALGQKKWDDTYRTQAAIALARHDDFSGLPVLAELSQKKGGFLKKVDTAEVREEVAQALGEIDNEAGLPILVSLLADAEAATRRDAAYALLDMTNAAALPALTSALGVDFGESEEGSYTISIHARIVRRALAVHAKHPSAGELWTKGVASPYAQVRFLALVGQQQGSS